MNTGISAVMLADGTIVGLSPLHREWFHTFDVPYIKVPPTTFYQQYGYRIVPAILLFVPAAILMSAWHRGK